MSSLCSSDPTWWRNNRIKEGQSSPALQPFLFTMDITHMRAIEVICISQMLAVIQCTEPSDNCPPHIMKCLCSCSLDQTMLDNLTVKMLSFLRAVNRLCCFTLQRAHQSFCTVCKCKSFKYWYCFMSFPYLSQVFATTGLDVMDRQAYDAKDRHAFQPFYLQTCNQGSHSCNTMMYKYPAVVPQTLQPYVT